MSKQANEQTNKQIYIYKTNKQATNKQTNTQTSKQASKQTNKQKRACTLVFLIVSFASA
jgi:hypothetical protein